MHCEWKLNFIEVVENVQTVPFLIPNWCIYQTIQ